MGYFKVCLSLLVISCLPTACGQHLQGQGQRESYLLTTIRAPPTTTPQSSGLKNESSFTNLKDKKPRLLNILFQTLSSYSTTPWYSEKSSTPYWVTASPIYRAVTSPYYWTTTLPVWYDQSKHRIYGSTSRDWYQQATSNGHMGTTAWWYNFHTSPQKLGHTTMWYPRSVSTRPPQHFKTNWGTAYATTLPPYPYSTIWHPSHKSTYQPYTSIKQWHYLTNYPYMTTPYWWQYTSTTDPHKGTTDKWHHTTHHATKSWTSPYGWLHVSTIDPYRRTTDWWHHTTHPQTTKSWTTALWWNYASTIDPYKRTTDWWHHTSHPYSWHPVSTTHPYKTTSNWWHYSTRPPTTRSWYYHSTTPLWQRPTTQRHYTKTTSPYQKYTTNYHFESTPYQLHKTTPLWFHAESSAAPQWYSTKATPWYHPITGLQTGNQFLSSAVTSDCSPSGWNVIVDLSILQQAYPGIKGSDMYLGEAGCVGKVDGYRVVFTQSLQGCGTKETITHENIIYRNELKYAPGDSFQPLDARQAQWTIEVECDVGRNGSSTLHIHHDRNITHPHVTGVGSYDVRMEFYSDSNFVNQIPGDPLRVPVGTLVYTKVFTTAVDWKVKMKVNTCYTMANTGDPNPVKYDLIRNGCESSQNTHFISQSTHETRFVFQDFEVKPGQEGFDIKCDVIFCAVSDVTQRCQQACSSYNIIG